jgi:hypothetical protein
MTRILILINYILLIRNTIQNVVPLYGQCGGIEYTGSTDCGTLGQCVFINSYYYQCLPITSPPNSNTVPLYGKCGGIGYTGSTQCDIQGYCVYSNPYYSQCLPVTPAPASTIKPMTIVSNSKTSSILTTLKQTLTTSLTKTTSAVKTTTKTTTKTTAKTTTTNKPTTTNKITTTTKTKTTYKPTTTTLKTTKKSTTTKTISSPTSAVAINTTSNQLVSDWGQCGGINYFGSTTCVSTSKCTVINSYYYQCIPIRSSTQTPIPITQNTSLTTQQQSFSTGTQISSTTINSLNGSTSIHFISTLKIKCKISNKIFHLTFSKLPQLSI